MIVVEGVDNSGKSTLISHLIESVLKGWPVQVSEGPPKYKGEQNERVKRYLDYHNKYVFDRHPCVSQPIYGMLRTHSDEIDFDLMRRFYTRKPLFIYCDPLTRGMDGHIERSTVDTKIHLASVHRNYEVLLEAYRHWAMEHAIIWYRIGDDIARVKAMVHGYINYEGDHGSFPGHQGIPREIRA